MEEVIERSQKTIRKVREVLKSNKNLEQVDSVVPEVPRHDSQRPQEGRREEDTVRPVHPLQKVVGHGVVLISKELLSDLVCKRADSATLEWPLRIFHLNRVC